MFISFFNLSTEGCLLIDGNLLIYMCVFSVVGLLICVNLLVNDLYVFLSLLPITY